MELNILPKFVDEAATPIAQSVGNSISGVWNLVFGNHVSLWLKKQEFRHQRNYEDFVNRTNAKVENIPQENLQEPEMYILGPAIEASKYYIDSEELREMFANLIASSVDSRANNITHPAFVEIIKQLSSLDASILKNFTFRKEFPIAQIRFTNDEGFYLIIYEHLMAFSNTNNEFEMRIASISNLQRLGLINIDYNVYLDNPTYYDFVEQHPAFIKANQSLQLEEYTRDGFKNYKVQKGSVNLTPLGQNFILACCITT
ncbi:DUF4393 domain-containing protein [Viridibacillus sp. NPDC096237]|uniref:DUF4393 domain-containing protein n=1 Tax=Viridibacillus sp. NPDC096237 TaxID=3390721 RepID=UPI003D06C13D